MTVTKGTALITGASTGIGATYADRLARRGYDLILVARDGDRLSALAERLTAETGVKAEVLKADLIAPADRARVEARLRDDPAITLFVNNAGMAVAGPVIESDVDALDRMVQLNTLALTRLAHAAGTGLVTRGGAIINIASIVALTPEVIGGTYSGTKAFVLNFTQALAAELEPRGVRVQAVLPGATRTELWDRASVDIDGLPAEWVMGVDEMVDAALLGFDRGETVTIPPLEEIEEFDALMEARAALRPKLSRDRAATRYRVAVDA